MDRTYDRNLPVSSLTVSRVSCINMLVYLFDRATFQTVFGFFLFLSFSLLTTFHLEKKLIKQNTTFTSKRNRFFFIPPVRCPLLPWLLPWFCVVSTFVLFLEWIVCLVCLFWFIFRHMLFFVRGTSRFFLFTPSSGICTILMMTRFSIFCNCSLFGTRLFS